MYKRIILNDFLRSKIISLTTIIFVAAAAMLVSLAAMLVVNLSGALDTLMKEAKTPHFMQMHSGDIDLERLEAFAEQNSNVDEYQVLEFLNIDGTQIVLGENSLANNVQDNGLSVQSEKFDFLLDLNGKVINVSDGELYVPVSYMRDNTTKIGDKAVIEGKEFTVVGFLRDSQMNSSLSGSKRFLVSKNDYDELKNHGNMEYLIEFRLKDVSQIGEFENAYASEGLEANGPAVTYQLFKLMNALSDGLLIAIILLVSALVVAIAFMCIRFALLTKIEGDYREIGVMKAIGLRISDIKKMYLAKYAMISALGCVVGFGLSLILKDMLLENIKLYMGESNNTLLALLLAIIGILCLFLTIIVFVNILLRRFREISAAEAIRFGSTQQKSLGARRVTLGRNRFMNTNIFLGMKDVLGRKRLYVTSLAVLVFSVFIIIVPQNLYNTISSDKFTQNMGVGNYDMRIDIQQTDNIHEKTSEIVEAITNDNSITRFTVLTTKTFQVSVKDGIEENMKVELGDHSIFPIEYSKGRAPITEEEIALSTIYADEWSKNVGDKIILTVEDVETELMVSGIYSDITNGGKTAKAVFQDSSSDVMWNIISAEFTNKTSVDKKISEYVNEFDFAKVSGIDEFVNQTFGSTILSVKKASYVAIAIALIITILVTLLFLKLLIVKDRYNISVMKAFGYTNKDITLQYTSRSVFVLIIGIILGTVLANTLGEQLAGMVISSFGASTFKFSVDVLPSYVFSPIMMICAVLIATIIGTMGIRRINITENMKE
ncbi:ABC transporter permease [Ornithinibacillus scapharcae]|uniref:ABC transporter permease n=1 Tax=Ornithinibacillus scapharcae TaxID=1147159 RepID=UPI000225B36B|nr:ABC transporter permease [Ornithinibacillus scapharcae]